MVRAIPVVSRLDEAQLVDIDLEALESLREAVEKQTLHFEQGGAQFAPGQKDRLPVLIQQIKNIHGIAQGLGIGNRVEIVGHTDGGGSESGNRRLSERRAERVLALLVSEGIQEAHLRASGVGASEPVREEVTEQDRATNRRASFRVVLAELP